MPDSVELPTGSEPGSRSWTRRDLFEVCTNGLPEDTVSDIYEAINDVLAASGVTDWDLLATDGVVTDHEPREGK